ncbi:tripartite tricarboxylate transporter substrate-binding protein [Thermodesulfobacteriota bacterium]
MSKKIILSILPIFLSLLFVFTVFGQDEKQYASHKKFYKGRAIEFICPASPGGSTDLVMRLVAPQFKELTGAAGVRMKNKHGSGGFEGYNYVYKAKPDGLTLGNGVLFPLTMNEFTEMPGCRYESKNFNYLMGIGEILLVAVVASDGPYKSIDDFKAGKNMRIAGSSISGPNSLGGLSTIALLDLDAKMVSGLKGQSACILSIQQGESSAALITESVAKPHIKEGKLRPLFILSNRRGTILPDVPALTELVTFTGEKKDHIDLWGGLTNFQLVLAPPNLSQERLDFLRDVVIKMVTPDFLKKASQIVHSEVQKVASGQEVTERIKAIAKKRAKINSLFKRLGELHRM